MYRNGLHPTCRSAVCLLLDKVPRLKMYCNNSPATDNSVKKKVSNFQLTILTPTQNVHQIVWVTLYVPFSGMICGLTCILAYTASNKNAYKTSPGSQSDDPSFCKVRYPPDRKTVQNKFPPPEILTD